MWSRAASKPPRASISWKCCHACSASARGEVLDEPRTARGIEHPADVGLLEQQQLGVARDSPRETRVRFRGIRRESRRRTDAPSTVSAPPTPAAKAATVVRSMFTHGSRCAIIASEVVACTVAAPASGLPDHLGHPRPELARGTQFRDRHELVVVGGEPEADLAERHRRWRHRRRPAAADRPRPRRWRPASSHDALAPRLWNTGPSTVIARTCPP